MTTTIAVIGAGSRSTHAVLAAEALRRAAQQIGAAFTVEVRSSQGILNALADADIATAGRVLLVGDDDLDAGRFASLQTSAASIEDVLIDASAVLAKLPEPAAKVIERQRRIVAVTSCPTGIAHTFMAAEGLQQAAKALGHAIRVGRCSRWPER